MKKRWDGGRNKAEKTKEKTKKRKEKRKKKGWMKGNKKTDGKKKGEKNDKKEEERNKLLPPWLTCNVLSNTRIQFRILYFKGIHP